MQIPTWITLKNVPSEFWNISSEITTRLGMLLGFNKKTTQVAKQCYYVAITIKDGWEIVGEMKNEFTKDFVTILVNYDHLPIHYKFCFDYSIRDYLVLFFSKSKSLRIRELRGNHQLWIMVGLMDKKG